MDPELMTPEEQANYQAVLDQWKRVYEDAMEQRRLDSLARQRNTYLQVPDTTGHWENPLPENESWIYSQLKDEKLNKGLENLLGIGGTVLMGEPGDTHYSGQEFVESVPYVGLPAYIAAGGTPGLLDLVGVGGAARAIRNTKRLTKGTLDFVRRRFGDDAVPVLDHYLDMYPKAGSLSIRDAETILREGRGDAIVRPIRPLNIAEIDPIAKGRLESIRKYGSIRNDPYFAKYVEHIRKNYDEATAQKFESVLDREETALMSGDYLTADAYDGIVFTVITELRDDGFMPPAKLLDAALSRVKDRKYNYETMSAGFRSDNTNLSPEERKYMREALDLQAGPAQDLDEIERKQLLKNERDAEKQAKKAAKQEQAAARQKPAVAEPVAVEEPVVAEKIPEQSPPLVEPVAEQVNPPATVLEPAEKYPGWTGARPTIGGTAYTTFGRNLSDDSKRGIYVVDSLADNALKSLYAQNGFFSAPIRGYRERSAARHNLTNYDDVSRKFQQDVQDNLRTGNIPAESRIIMDDKYKGDIKIDGLKTPTWEGGFEERPNSRTIIGYDAPGHDLYELIFREMLDERLHALNPNYFVPTSR